MAGDASGIDVDRHEALRLVGQFTDHISLCACGAPEEFLARLLAGLNALPEPGQARPVVEGWDPLTEPADMMTLYLLDCWDLSEHGTSVNGSWLRPAGTRLRDALRKVDLFAGSADLDSLLSGGRWWKNEAVLHGQKRGRVTYVELGQWQVDED